MNVREEPQIAVDEKARSQEGGKCGGTREVSLESIRGDGSGSQTKGCEITSDRGATGGCGIEGEVGLV